MRRVGQSKHGTQKYRCRDCRAFLYAGQVGRSVARLEGNLLSAAHEATSLSEVARRVAGCDVVELELYVSQSEAARRLGVSRQRVGHLKREGRFRVLVIFGREWLDLSSLRWGRRARHCAGVGGVV